MAVCLICGCQGNTTALRNPFATPNRVPPPATRVLQPGAAQPYYPGDRLPGNPAGSVFPSGAVGTPIPGSVPPGGWGISPQANATPTPNVFPASAQIALGPVPSANGPPIQINVDQQNLRFAPAPIPGAGQGLWNPPQAAVQTAGFQEPIAPVTFVQAPANVAPREVRIRAVKSPNVDLAHGTSQDGFRPQGSRLINRRKPEQPRFAPRQGVAPTEFGPVREDVARFGFDPQYQWLRGQIQVSQATGQWHLRYAVAQSGPVQGGPDQFGGQVLIENPHLLGGLQPGDYVQVQGRLIPQPDGTGNYTVSIVQRQRVQ
ncbi:MAG: hypothetical protein GXP28_04845 [Planctomycetes bacterium]|nr:hypothetical protein [Planctomycetota bacterium]